MSDLGGVSTPKPPTSDNAGPIIKESQESAEYQQDLQVVLGTAFGVIAMVGLIALAFLLYRVYRSRHTALSYGQNDDIDVFERDIAVDIEGKSQPVILLLYAYDCPIHEQVVGALAAFLMEACGVTITLDLFEEGDILERGIDDWLVDRLQEADYIIVLCSLGARLRCSKKRVKFKSDEHRALPDYFAVAVDYVAEKMRAEKQKGMSMNKFVAVYMEYSTKSDIPPQLETAVQFCLMKDIHKLHTHLNIQGPESDKSDTASQISTCENHYHETETGAVLKATIEQAKTFFNENPTWLEDRLEIASSRPPVRGHRARKYRQTPMEEPLLTLIGTPPVLHCSQTAPCHILESRDRLKQFKHFSQTMELVPWVTNRIPQGRQNSLPSLLASSGLAVPPSRQTLSRSMDSFTADQNFQQDHDGLPCFFCNSAHMYGRPECRLTELQQDKALEHFQISADVSANPSQTSLHHLTRGLTPSRSQTVLQAEVHQEWGHTSRGTLEQKSATFAGDSRSWDVDQVVGSTPGPYQSLPPHHPPPHQYNPSTSAVMEWDTPVGLRKWPSDYPDSPAFKILDGRDHRLTHRSLSNVSVSTEDSSSLPDVDLLERDLRSIQNISSFHDFITASSFTSDTFTHNTSNGSGLEMTNVLKPYRVVTKQLRSHESSCVYMNGSLNTESVDRV
ncbi:unnamed protein product [Candidula unifasciata]|uniref:SEFIR domain-containing protein n=1 Tax=Candidula unifasciata TaxID=100452 RepID=A0A8S3Z7F7_9EUPU|nr:unnamed protein product [Candidula unifasciata]